MGLFLILGLAGLAGLVVAGLAVGLPSAILATRLLTGLLLGLGIDMARALAVEPVLVLDLVLAIAAGLPVVLALLFAILAGDFVDFGALLESWVRALGLAGAGDLAGLDNLGDLVEMEARAGAGDLTSLLELVEDRVSMPAVRFFVFFLSFLSFVAWAS